MTPNLRLRLRLRAGLVLAACLATVAAMLSLGGAPARADDCFVNPPWTIQVSGPNGVGTTQPPYAQLQLLALDRDGHVVTCSGAALSFTWSVSDATGGVLMGGWTLNPTGNTATTIAGAEGTITYQVVGKAGSLPLDTPQVTVTYVDPGPTGTTLQASPAAPVANAPVTLTAGTTSPSGTQHWTWDFGDGQTTTTDNDTGNSVDHTYTAAGDYTAKVTVSDYLDKTDSATVPVHVAAAPAPLAPLTAAFSVTPSSLTTGQSIGVDGSGSATDPSGHVTGWSWDFGDGTTGTGRTATHPYTSAGTYTVTETVSDDLGRTATTTHGVTVTDPVIGGPPVTSGGPHAAWSLVTTSPIAGALTAFDGTSSTDDGGTIVDYAWKFGDGQTAAGAIPRHTFGDGGSYPVTLTVTDDSGRTSSATHQVTVAYAPPVAAFSWAPAAPVAGSALSFDGSASTAQTGGIATYAWDFGDGLTSSEVKPGHTYTSAGDFPVSLTVTDAAGHSATVAQVVHVQWPATDLAVSVGGSTPTAGKYTYRVTVKNLGHAGAHGILLTNALDPAQMLASKVTAPAGVTCGGVALGATGTITCKAPSAVLAAGKSWVVTFTVRQPARTKARQVTETSTVHAANPDGITQNNTARLTTAV